MLLRATPISGITLGIWDRVVPGIKLGPPACSALAPALELSFGHHQRFHEEVKNFFFVEGPP